MEDATGGGVEKESHWNGVCFVVVLEKVGKYKLFPEVRLSPHKYVQPQTRHP